MYILRKHLFIGLFFSLLSVSFFGTISANAWLWSGNNGVSDSIPCGNNDCTLQGGVDNVKTVLDNSGIHTEDSLTNEIIKIVTYFLGFITLIAVIYIIYAGFQVMIGGGDEEKMKKAKNTILYVIVGISIMWLAYAIVEIILNIADPKKTTFQNYKNTVQWTIPTASAYTENDLNTFADYQKQLQAMMETLESEFRLGGSVSAGSVSLARSLIQEAYLRLPDNPDDAVKNESAKRAADLAIGLMEKNLGSQLQVQNGIQGIGQFLGKVSIRKMSGSISASPSSGNVPLTSSFIAQGVIDPSGVNPVNENYIWWTRENGGNRRELGRGKTLTYTFTQEGTYQVFLDVLSGSRNKKGYTDVLPLSASTQIDVKPRVGNIALLINGVNVSNLDTIKINPNIGKIGVLIDATASRAVSNGTITKTKWDFGNGNALSIDGPPTVERQIFANQGTYKVSLEMTTNEGVSFKKDIQFVVRDPAAVIQITKQNGNIGEPLSMSALSYFTNTSNVEYSWKVTSLDGDNKTVVTKEGSSFSYSFQKVGNYIVTLTSKNPNGNTDADSKTITIDSRDPTVNLDSPVAINPEKPNTFLFDASRSFDTDTNSTKDLTYSWMIDGTKVELLNPEKGGSIGRYTFSEIGNHKVSVTVVNTHGKVATTEKSFTVNSTLTIGMNIVPRAAPINTNINIQARSPKAAFFEWNTGDGSPSINGTSDHIEHIYKKTGIYTVTLSVKNIDGSQTNTTSQTVYVTDTNSPFALIDIKNGSDAALEDFQGCSGEGAFIIDRSQNVTIDGSQSINVDGNASGLSYTWKYLDRVKTGPTLSEKFTELGCFPIELTVKSDKNGVSSTSKKYIQIKNIIPKITSITSSIDATKKDSQKILVNVSANGVSDPDGVVTSYIWFYKTESDSEPQSIRITQTPKTTFILPNVTEKYTFGVIIEDNDGAKLNSTESIKDQSPLIISNDDGNVNLPLITLNTSKTQILAGEPVDFIVSAKNILGVDITGKSEYQWDFDGDGKIDKKTNESHISYTYENSGNYNVKVKVIYNGISNSKYQTLTVKNELKASIKGYKSADNILLVNTSQGAYDRVFWKAGEIKSDSLTNIIVPSSVFGSGNTVSMTISSGENETATSEIDINSIETLSGSTASGILYQSYPITENDIISLKSRGEKVVISLFGNDGTNYTIDSDLKIDSDLDGIPDNDIDNKNTASYTDGSVYQLININEGLTREQKVKIGVLSKGTLIGTKTITIVRTYIIDNQNTNPSDIKTGSGTDGFSLQDKENLDTFQSKIRSLSSDERIILSQSYNKLIENWGDVHDRTQNLLDIQEIIDGSKNISEGDKTALSDLVDLILVGNAQADNEVTIASTVITGIIPQENVNRGTILQKLEEIKGHPSDLSANKTLGKEILELIKNDNSIPDADKILIKSQLSIIVNGGQASIPSSEVVVGTTTNGGFIGNILGFMSGVVKIFGVILGILIFILLIGYIIYRISRKNDDMGFQDFLIDSVFHMNGKKTQNTTLNVKTPVSTVISQVVKVEDPLKNTLPEEITPGKSISESINQGQYSEPKGVIDPLSIPEEKNIQNIEATHEEEKNIPDWLKTGSSENSDPLQNPPSIQDKSSTPEISENSEVSENIQSIEEVGIGKSEPMEPVQETIPQGLPAWLTGEVAQTEKSSTLQTEEESEIGKNPLSIEMEDQKEQSVDTKIGEEEIIQQSESLPDWLIDSVNQSENKETNIIPISNETHEDILVEVENESIEDGEQIETKTTLEKEKTKKVKKPTAIKTKKDESMKEVNPNTQNDLPDWLK